MGAWVARLASLLVWLSAAALVSAQLTPLPPHVCGCWEPHWREFWDKGRPTPTFINMTVVLSYGRQGFNVTLQEQFVAAVAIAADVVEDNDLEPYHRVTIVSIVDSLTSPSRRLMSAGIDVSFSVRVPAVFYVPAASISKRTEEARSKLTEARLNDQLLSRGLTALSSVLKDACVEGPDAGPSACLTAPPTTTTTTSSSTTAAPTTQSSSTTTPVPTTSSSTTPPPPSSS